MDVAVFDTIEAAKDGTLEAGTYLGTLENEGVDIAPFNEFEDEVPQELKDQIDSYREQIVSGEYTVGS